jgi:hypothetical protein
MRTSAFSLSSSSFLIFLPAQFTSPIAGTGAEMPGTSKKFDNRLPGAFSLQAHEIFSRFSLDALNTLVLNKPTL